MKKLDNKGFTLIELIATLILLMLVMGIGIYSITKIIDNSKKKNYELLVKEIKNAAELYYQECKYGDSSLSECGTLDDVKLGDLVKYGFLTGNSKDDDDVYTLVNPNTGESITDCRIKINYDAGKVNVQNIGINEKCPVY